jgi:hypothetical protein
LFGKLRFQVLTASSMQIAVFWGVAQCSVLETGRHFRGVYCFHHQGHCVMSHRENLKSHLAKQILLWNPKIRFHLNQFRTETNVASLAYDVRSTHNERTFTCPQ